MDTRPRKTQRIRGIANVVWNAGMDNQLRELHKQNIAIVKIAEIMGLHKNTVNARVKRMRLVNDRSRHSQIILPFDRDAVQNSAFKEAKTRAQENARLVVRLTEFHKNTKGARFWLGKHGEICSNLVLKGSIQNAPKHPQVRD